MPKLGMEKIRRDEIIQATTRCIIEKGMANLSIKNIASEANLSTGVIYHYFKNKEDILLTVLRETFWQSHISVMKTVTPLKSNKEKVLRHIENINTVPKKNPEHHAILLNYLGEAKSNPVVNKIVKKFFHNLKSFSQEYLEDGVEKKEFYVNNTSHLASIIISLGLGLGIMWAIDPDSFELDEMEVTYKEIINKFLEK